MPRIIEPLPHHYMSVYNFIIEYKVAHDGNSPTMRMIMAKFPTVVPSTSMAQWILRRLQAEGLIYRARGVSRSIEVIGGRWLPPEK